ncbi:hypothetical protein JP74_22000 [Devosia sp. 17-2-E-8]|nr:hypothetical protein JP74_22000 [Devosia sp. 17-2-E-8]
MATLGERIRQARIAQGMSQAELGRRAGITQQALAGLESGRTSRSRHTPELAQALGMRLQDLTGEEQQEIDFGAHGAQAAPAQAIDLSNLPRDIPVLGQAIGGSTGDFTFNGQVIDYLRRPPGIATMKDVFGLYVTGTSMYPKFEEGEPIYVSASRPPAIGDYVVVELHEAGDGEGNAGFIKRLLKRTPTTIKCEQFNPPMEIEYDREKVKALFRVIPLTELVGI